jgi:hypothetical protein
MKQIPPPAKRTCWKLPREWGPKDAYLYGIRKRDYDRMMKYRQRNPLTAEKAKKAK